MARDRNEHHNWTAFADALDAWLYEESARRRSRFSRRKLAEELGVSYGATDNWFTRGTLPEPEAFWALVRVTGWTPEHLAALCGYAELPPHTLGPWDFLREELDASDEFRATEKERIRAWIDAVALRYRAKPKRPGTRGGRRTVLAVPSLPSSETPAPAEKPAPARTRKELTTAGK